MATSEGKKAMGSEDVTDANYGAVLNQYMADMSENERMEKELRKMEIMEKTFSNSIFDFIFPWHMQLGRFEKAVTVVEGDEASDTDFAYTPFKTFNRRRNYLVWMHSRKFDNIFSAEERQKLEQIENRQFRWSVAMKGLSVVLLSHLRLLWRPMGRPWLFDLGLVYFSMYALLGSSIPGVFLTWPEYLPLTEKMF